MATTTKQRVDAYQAITDRIVSALETGTVPWQRPWRNVAGVGPTSMSSRKEYRGINWWMLSITAMAESYQSMHWGTYNQIRELGGQVRKGEHGTQVVLWKPVTKKKEKDDDKTESYLVIKLFNVFNADQADWPEGSKRPVEAETPEVLWNPLNKAEGIANGMPSRPEVKHGGNRAFYSPLLDYIGMPPRDAFDYADGYYSTLFHEMVHSTGHKSRVGRDGIEAMDGFGSEKYSREELIAEMGAAYLCSEAGVPPRIDQSAAYIASWLKALRDDKKMVVQAASQAQKATDFILDTLQKTTPSKREVGDVTG